MFVDLRSLWESAPSGSIAAIDGFVIGQASTLVGDGALAGTHALAFGQTATAAGTGALAGTDGLVFGQTATETGSGALSDSTGLIFAQTGTLQGTGALLSTTTLTFAQTSTLSGQGSLASTSGLIFDQTGAAANLPSGAMSGIDGLVFGLQGTLDQPPQAIPSEIPAGRRVRSIYRITLDGQVFEFATYAQAIEFLATAEALAVDHIQRQLPTEPGPLPKPTLPDIRVNTRQLRKAANETRKAIKSVYDRELMKAELRMLLELDRRREEDESLVLLM